MLVERPGKGSDGDVTSVAIVMSLAITRQKGLRCMRLFLEAVRKGSVVCAQPGFVADMSRANHAPLGSLRVVKKCCEIWVSLGKPKRENELLLVLVLKTELEPRFIISYLMDHLDRAIKENNEVS